MRTKADILQDLRRARDERDVIQAQLKTALDAVDAIEQELLASMAADGLDQIRGAGLTVSVMQSIVPQVRDWEQFKKYVLRHGALHLLERRVHTNAWREEVEGKSKGIPGVEPYERTRLHVRTGD